MGILRPGRVRRIVLAATVVVLLVVGGGAVAIVRAAQDDPPAGCQVPTAAPTAPAGAADQAPGGGAVAVAEKGFSLTGDGLVSFGVLLRNTSSRQVAYRTRVRLQITDAGGRVATNPLSARQLVLEVPVILPGERIGVGNWAGLAKNPHGESVVPAVLTVDVDQTHWMPREGAGAIFATVTATPRSVYLEPAGPGTVTIEFTITSGYCRLVARHGVMVLFRDGAGTLIGGTQFLDILESGCIPGTVDQRPYAQGLPTDIDPARTEIYAYCDTATSVKPTNPAAVGSNYDYR